MRMFAIQGSPSVPYDLVLRHGSQLLSNHQMTVEQCDGHVRSVEVACAILDVAFMPMPKVMSDRICEMAARDYMAEIQLKELSDKIQETAQGIADAVARAANEGGVGHHELELVKGRIEEMLPHDGLDPSSLATFWWVRHMVVSAIAHRQLELLMLQLGGEEA